MWGKFGRRDLTIEDFRPIPFRLVDVCRVLSTAYSSNDPGKDAFSHFRPETAVYLVPEGVPAGVFFVETLKDAAYIDSAAFVLFRRGSMADSLVPRLEAFWRVPAHQSKVEARLVQTANAIRRVLNRGLGIRDWGVV